MLLLSPEAVQVYIKRTIARNRIKGAEIVRSGTKSSRVRTVPAHQSMERRRLYSPMPLAILWLRQISLQVIDSISCRGGFELAI
jgi:hypothetical protein